MIISSQLGEVNCNVQSSTSKKSENEINRAAEAFETMLFKHLIKRMFESSESQALWGEGTGASMFKSLWIDAIAQAGGASCLGLKKYIVQSMDKKNQGDLKDNINVKI